MDSIKKTPAPKITVPKTDKSQADNKELQKYMLISGIIIASIVIVGGVLIYWLASKYTYQSNLNKAQDQLINSLTQKQKDLQALKPNLAAITAVGANGISDAELILRAVPTTQNFEGLIAILERMGAESGVKVTNISQSNSTGAISSSANSVTNTNAQGSGSQATPFVFTVNVEGSYPSIIEFLKKTEKSARVINFNNMSINGNTGNITANLTMTTFYKPPANINSTYVPLK